MILLLSEQIANILKVNSEKSLDTKTSTLNRKKLLHLSHDYKKEVFRFEKGVDCGVVGVTAPFFKNQPNYSI